MVEHQEKLWTFDAVEAGQIGNETTVEITAENIARYARIALNSDPFYQSSGSDLVAMPTMVMAYAPLLREEIADANGFVAFEVSETARSQTPFAKCEARWFLPVVPGQRRLQKAVVKSCRSILSGAIMYYFRSPLNSSTDQSDLQMLGFT